MRRKSPKRCLVTRQSEVGNSKKKGFNFGIRSRKYTQCRVAVQLCRVKWSAFKSRAWTWLTDWLGSCVGFCMNIQSHALGIHRPYHHLLQQQQHNSTPPLQFRSTRHTLQDEAGQHCQTTQADHTHTTFRLATATEHPHHLHKCTHNVLSSSSTKVGKPQRLS